MKGILNMNADDVSSLKNFAIKLASVGDKIEKFQLFIGAMFVAFFLIVVFVDVLYRETGEPILWTEEIARLLYVWAIFFGSGVVLRRDGHFKIDVFIQGASGGKKLVLDILEFIFISIFVIVLIVPGYEFAMMGLQRVSNPSGFPLIFATACIPAGASFMAYYMVERLILKIAGVEINSKD